MNLETRKVRHGLVPCRNRDHTQIPVAVSIVLQMLSLGQLHGPHEAGMDTLRNLGEHAEIGTGGDRGPSSFPWPRNGGSRQPLWQRTT